MAVLLTLTGFAPSDVSAQALQPGFVQEMNNDVGGRTRAWGIATGDFNNDGIQDVVSGDTFGDVHLFLGDGNGNLLPQSGPVVINQSFHNAYALAAADFDLDGNDDFVLARTVDTDEGRLDLYLGNGTGGFAATGFPQNGLFIGVAGTDPLSLTAGDVDNDGDPDLISGEIDNAWSDDAEIILWRNQAAQGAPTLFLPELIIAGSNLADPDPEAPPYFPPSAYLHAYGLALGDVTDDGYADLLVGDKAHYLYIYENLAGVGFAPIRYNTIGTRPFAYDRINSSFNEGMSITVGDFNDDGWLDFATGNTGPDDAAVRMWVHEGLDASGRPFFTGIGIVGQANPGEIDARGLATIQLDPVVDSVPDLVFGTYDGNIYRLFSIITDTDSDGIIDPFDNAPTIANAPRLDMNADGGINYLDQLDNDFDGIGDPADDDDDNDGVPDILDNCPFTANADQADADGDGIGDACDPLHNVDDDGDGVFDGPLDPDMWLRAYDAKARWAQSDTHFIIRVDALSRAFQSEFVQTFVDAAILSPSDWEAEKLQNYNGIGDSPALPGYNIPADLPGGMETPLSLGVIPGMLWDGFDDPDPMGWLNERISNPNFEITLHGTYHANNTPLGDWASMPDRNFFSCETCGLTLEENYQLLRIGMRTLLGEYGEDQWIQDAGAVEGVTPFLDWSGAANPLITYLPPYNTSDTTSREAMARLGFKGFSASIFEEEGWLAQFFSPEGSHHEQFDQFGMFHASADRQVDPEQPAGMTYEEYLVSITQSPGLNTWLIEEVEWSTRYCNDLDRLVACPSAPGGVNRENNMVDLERWEKWLTLLTYAQNTGQVMTIGDYALAMQFDNAPTVPNPDQADADADGIGDVIDGAALIVPDVLVEAPADGKTAVLEATLANAGTPLPNQVVTFQFDSDGNGVDEFYERMTGADGVASLEVTVTGPVGMTWPFSAAWGGVLVSSMESAIIEIVDTTPPEIESVSASPDTLLVANHKMVDVEVSVVATDAGDPNPPVCVIQSITSNEAANGRGDGNTEEDIVLTGPLSASLRAERSGPGSDRIYTIVVECSDSFGNSATAETTVIVPHDRRK